MLGCVFGFNQGLFTVDHGILFCKLSETGLSENSLQWFRSYITDRKQCTYCGNELSDELPVTHGVPQGSILGPLLYLSSTSMICQAF